MKRLALHIIFAAALGCVASAQTFNLDGTRADQPQSKDKNAKNQPAKSGAKSAKPAPKSSSGPVAVDQSPALRNSAPADSTTAPSADTKTAAQSTKPAHKGAKASKAKTSSGTESASARKSGKRSGKAVAKKSGKPEAKPQPAVEEAATAEPEKPAAPVVQIPSAESRFASSQPPSAQLQQQIQSALHSDASLHASGVSVNVTDDGISVSGSVDNGKDKVAAQRIVQSFAGNRKVKETLTVLNNTPPSRGEGAAVLPASDKQPADATTPSAPAQSRAERRAARRKALDAQKSFTESSPR